jgi:hypothetical protein
MRGGVWRIGGHEGCERGEEVGNLVGGAQPNRIRDDGLVVERDSGLQTRNVWPIDLRMLRACFIAHSFRGSSDPLKKVSQGISKNLISVEVCS